MRDSIKQTTYSTADDRLTITMTDGRIYELSADDQDLLWCSIREADEERQYKC